MVTNINLINSNMNDDVNKLREVDTELATQLDKIRVHLTKTDTAAKNAERRLETCENLAHKNELAIIDLGATKASLKEFVDNSRDVNQ